LEDWVIIPLISNVGTSTRWIRVADFTQSRFDMEERVPGTFQYISNKMQLFTVYLYLEIALHVLGGTYNSSTVAAVSSNGVTSIRCCRYSCMRSWWWVEVPLETCRAVSRCKLWKVASCWIYIGIYLRCTDPWTLKIQVPGTYLLGGEVGHRFGADALAKTKIPTLDGYQALITQVVAV